MWDTETMAFGRFCNIAIPEMPKMACYGFLCRNTLGLEIGLHHDEFTRTADLTRQIIIPEEGKLKPFQWVV